MTIRLVPFSEEHVAGFEAMLGDPDLQRFTRLPADPPDGFAQGWLERQRAGRREGTSEAFAIVDGGGELLGIAVVPNIERQARQAELGYLVAPHARGRGVATKALELLTRWAFAELGLMRATLMISAGNEASKVVAERNGYVREGVLRSLWFKGELREDTELWSLLPGEGPLSAGPS